MVIQLGRLLPNASCDLPESLWAGNPAKKKVLHTLLFGLAPGGVYQATMVTHDTGELLPHLFTLTPRHARGGMFSVALSLGSPPVAVSDHPALWSSDFPLNLKPETQRPFSLLQHIRIQGPFVNSIVFFHTKNPLSKIF